MTAEASILELAGVCKRFAGLVVADEVSFVVRRGSLTALIGPNGAGKSTLFNLVSGVHRAERGSILFDGVEIGRMARHRIVRCGLVRTFQITKTLAKMSVLDNMMLAAPAQPGERLWALYLKPVSVRQREREIRAQALDLLERFGLARMAPAYAGTLSGGQRKLLEFARALMVHPAMIMLDEPLAGVNPTLGRQILDYIRALQAERDITFLFVEHDMTAVMSVSEHVIVMSEGRVIADGPPEVVRRDPAVIDAYLGRAGTAEPVVTRAE